MRAALLAAIVLHGRLTRVALRGRPRLSWMAFRPDNKKRTFMAISKSSLLDDSDFNRLYEELKAYDDQRETVIKRSRDIGKLSKQAIFSLHRGATDEAAARLEGAEKAARELLPIIQQNPTLRQGSFSAAIEEYAEARTFSEYLVSGRLISSKEVDLAEMEEYLGGVLDFTGELNRYAVARATTRDKAAVQRCRDLVEEIMGQFLRFDLRNGSLRKKFDGVKYTLKKLENTLYELSLTEAGIVKKPEDVPDVDVAGATADARADDDV